MQSFSLAGLRLFISFGPFLRALLTLLVVELTLSHCFFHCFNSAKAPIFVNASIALTHKTAPVALVGWRATAKKVGREGGRRLKMFWFMFRAYKKFICDAQSIDIYVHRDAKHKRWRKHVHQGPVKRLLKARWAAVMRMPAGLDLLLGQRGEEENKHDAHVPQHDFYLPASIPRLLPSSLFASRGFGSLSLPQRPSPLFLHFLLPTTSGVCSRLAFMDTSSQTNPALPLYNPSTDLHTTSSTTKLSSISRACVVFVPGSAASQETKQKMQCLPHLPHPSSYVAVPHPFPPPPPFPPSLHTHSARPGCCGV